MFTIGYIRKYKSSITQTDSHNINISESIHFFHVKSKLQNLITVDTGNKNIFKLISLYNICLFLLSFLLAHKGDIFNGVVVVVGGVSKQNAREYRQTMYRRNNLTDPGDR